MVTSSHYVGHTIECWNPAEFTASHRDYANEICWVSNTYYVPMKEQIPLNLQTSEQAKQISYYQWVPFILLLQAFLCLAPRMIWKLLSSRAGLSISSMVGMAAMASFEKENRDKVTSRFIAYQIHRYLRARHLKNGLCCRSDQGACGKVCLCLREEYQGSYLTISFFLVKILYFLNGIGQLYILDSFLGMDFHFYGISELYRMLSGQLKEQGGGRFPTVTLCSFTVRRQTQLHTHIVQCVLPINIFNERFFLALWFWFALLSIVSLYSTIVWLWRLCWPRSRHYYIRRQLALYYPDASKENIKKFANLHFKCDGILITRLLSSNAGVLPAAEVMCYLWRFKFPEQKPLYDPEHDSFEKLLSAEVKAASSAKVNGVRHV